MNINNLTKEEQEKFAKNYETKIKKDAAHYWNLLAVAWADGKLEEKEKVYLGHIYAKYGMDKNTMMLVEMWKSQNLYPLTKLEEKLEQILELVLLAMCDGDVDDEELRICEEVAYKYGLHPNIISQMVEINWRIIEGLIDIESDYDSLLAYINGKFQDQADRHEKKQRDRWNPDLFQHRLNKRLL